MVMIVWLRRLFAMRDGDPDARIPRPPFRASKRTGQIMYGLWYGLLSPDQARQNGRQWGFSEASLEEMIAEATMPPSYWSQHTGARGRLPVAIVRQLRSQSAITVDAAASRRRS